MSVVAIDPGNEQSAWLELDPRCVTPIGFGIVENNELLRMLQRWPSDAADHLAIEMVASYGMPVGREIFDTVLWTGRYIQAWSAPHTLVYRRDVKMHLCGNNAAKDANVRQALIDRFGPGKELAVGTKKQPGPLYGVTADVWSALAIATTWMDRWGVEETSKTKSA